MAVYNSAPITDPDSLSYTIGTNITTLFTASTTDELLIDYTNKVIALKAVGTMNQDGVTIKCVYSKLKEVWRTDATLVKFPFPMGPITDEQFEMINGWNWDKTNTSGSGSATTVELLRTGGWSVVDTNSVVQEMWTGIITLGTFAATTDQAYYQQVAGGVATNFKLTNNVNQAVQVYKSIATTTSGSSSSTTATVNTVAAHGLVTGDSVTITGVTPSGYNGTYVVTVTDTDTFTYTTSGSNIGAITVQGSVYLDRRGYFKVFLREYAKLYVQSANTEIGASSMTYQAYRFPLSNGTDLKVTHVDNAVGGGATLSGSWAGGSATVNTATAHGLVSGESVVITGVTPAGYNGTYTVTVTDSDTFTYTVADPGGVITVQGTVAKAVYTKVNITYLRHTNDALYNVRGNYNTGSVVYAVADVVKDTGNNRWYKCIVGYTSNATLPSANVTNWAVYEGERQIGTAYYPFTVIIDGDTSVAATASGSAVRAEIYEKIQWSLRQNSDIDADATASVTGKTADLLLKFVGDTLVTYNGVYIDSYNSNDTNDIEYYDALGNKATFPYVASITINFGDNLKNDASAKYWLFFTNANGNTYGSSSAIIVKDATSPTPVDITGNVSGASSVAWTFDYDNNIQGGRTAATNADVTAVALGLTTGQYVKATTTIAKSKANSVSLVAALERNYNNPA